MQRDRRCNDNWALVHAQNLAIKFKAPLTIFYSLNGNFSNANVRQYAFMLEGMVDTVEDLKKNEIPFHLRKGSVNSSIKKYISEINAGYLVTDFSPLRVYKKRVARLAKEIKIPFELVDAHNIIPTWYLSDKQEFAAHTIRRKIHLLLEEFLHPIPRIISHPFIEKGTHEFFDPKALLGGLKVDTSVQEINWLVPSEENGNKIM